MRTADATPPGKMHTHSKLVRGTQIKTAKMNCNSLLYCYFNGLIRFWDTVMLLSSFCNKPNYLKLINTQCHCSPNQDTEGSPWLE